MKDTEHMEHTISAFSQVSDPWKDGNLAFFWLMPRNQIAKPMGHAPSSKILFDENDCSFI